LSADRAAGLVSDAIRRSKVRQVGVAVVAVSVVVLLLEVLVRAELAEESEEHVERLDHRLIILQLVYGHVAHGADDLRVVLDVHVNFRARERSRLEGLFHLGRPLLHQRFNIGHILRVVHRWRRPRFVKVLYTADPARHFARLLVGVFNRVHIDWSRARHIFALHVLEFQDSFIFMVQARFI
jgi:hypothetical protein